MLAQLVLCGGRGWGEFRIQKSGVRIQEGRWEAEGRRGMIGKTRERGRVFVVLRVFVCYYETEGQMFVLVVCSWGLDQNGTCMRILTLFGGSVNNIFLRW